MVDPTNGYGGIWRREPNPNVQNFTVRLLTDLASTTNMLITLDFPTGKVTYWAPVHMKCRKKGEPWGMAHAPHPVPCHVCKKPVRRRPCGHADAKPWSWCVEPELTKPPSADPAGARS